MASHSVSSETPRGSGEEAVPTRNKPGSVQSFPLAKQPNWFVRTARAVFGYRKTSLSFLVFATLLVTVLVSQYDNLLALSVPLPTDSGENALLHSAWAALQEVGRTEHTYTSSGNDAVHAYLEKEIAAAVHGVPYAAYDNDTNNNVMFAVKYLTYDLVLYYESNNLVARVNGLDPALPALLLSAHFDSVPSSYGVTDDGMGVASLLAVLQHYTAKHTKQPKRTIVFNFNNNEEFGLYGANAFLSHPWAANVGYFLNLEGTGAGGKAVLFRGTDYGIVKHFSSVRYPYATSVFQQGFNNHLIHSETDYAVYKDKGGLRGLDVAFYKPRDLYHTAGDNIKNVNINSLWHMLSVALDFTKELAYHKIDLDSDNVQSNTDFAAYASFLNYFVAFPTSKVAVANIVLLAVVPVVSLLLLIVIFRYRKGWNVNFVNVIKFPLSFILSIFVLNVFTNVVIVSSNKYLANNSVGTLVATLFATFVLLNYAILNGLNFLFKSFKGHQHDEKLIVLIQVSFLTWVALLWSTVKLTHNKIGDDHTGEFVLAVLFLLQSVGAMFGLLGWSFKTTKKRSSLRDLSSQPLLGSSSGQQYGSQDEYNSYDDSLSLSLHSDYEDCEKHETKSFGYDWLVQFLLVVPLSSIIIYNSGSLVLHGLNKSIQESEKAQDLIYKLIEVFVIIWAVPFLPFVFKVNRLVVLVLLGVVLQGLFIVATRPAFDVQNPLKLRFLQTIDLNTSPPSDTVGVLGRSLSLVEEILEDMPSIKSSQELVHSSLVGDGMLLYSWDSVLAPKLPEETKSLKNYLGIEVLRNSSSSSDAPFGLLTGEIKLNVPKNRNCKVNFNVSDSTVRIFGKEAKRSPVKTIIVYADAPVGNDTISATSGAPEGFSRDHDGNYVFKDYEGISQLQLNKLDWDKPYHFAFQWVPEIVDSDNVGSNKINVKQLGVEVECYWSELGYVAESDKKTTHVAEAIPAYAELLHYSPNYVSWANRDRGMVSVKEYIKV